MEIQGQPLFPGSYTDSWPNIKSHGVESHTQLLSYLVNWSYEETSAHAILLLYRGTPQKGTEKQVCNNALTEGTSLMGFAFFSTNYQRMNCQDCQSKT